VNAADGTVPVSVIHQATGTATAARTPSMATLTAMRIRERAAGMAAL
jgi:hypothetical protein